MKEWKKKMIRTLNSFVSSLVSLVHVFKVIIEWKTFLCGFNI